MQPAKVDAFRLLMSASTERSHLPSPIEPGEHRQLIATERLYNQVVDYMKSTSAGLVDVLVTDMSFAFPCFILYRCSYDLCWFV